MEADLMRREPVNYKGYIVEYSGVSNPETPIEVFFDKRYDAWHICVNHPISPFLIDVVAEEVRDLMERFKKDEVTLEGIKAEFSAFKERLLAGNSSPKRSHPEAGWNQDMKSAVSEILEKTGF